MRSAASIKGHPIHPMLIAYPFAFLTGAFGFNVAAAGLRNRDLETVGRYLVPAGIATGLAAATAGLVDYLHSVPPNSSAKERATRHALLNTAAMGLFTTSWLLQRARRRSPLSLVLQGAGTVAMSLAGWMGGTLVYRNQIGVDHRYADAGTWQEESVEGPDALALAPVHDELGLNQMKLVHAGGQRIVVGRTETGLAAFQDRCTHRGGPLSDGALICGTVQCPWHGSQFDVHTGEVKCGPAREPIRTYPTEHPRLT